MKHLSKSLLAILATLPAQVVVAEGFDKALPSNDFLFQPGGYAEFGGGYLMPDITGTFETPSGTIGSGNVGGDFFTGQIALKYDLTEKISIGFQYSQPYGLNAQYPGTTPPLAPPPARGTGGDFGAEEFAISARYKFDPNHSMFGSVRVQKYGGYLNRGGVRFDFKDSTDLGYSLGYAFERPENMMRFDISYTSGVDHSQVTTPANDGLVAIADPTSPIGVNFVPATAGTPLANETIHRTPQSIEMNYRTRLRLGDGKNLLFARYRWANWSEADITFNGLNPTQFDDSHHFGLGMGRLVADNLAVIGNLEYRTGGESPRAGLTPFEDSIGLTIGARYILNDDVVIQGAYTYVKFMDATTTSGGSFTSNSAQGVAFKIGYYF